MYPMFPDILRTVQQNVTRDIMPDLGSDYAREQATGLLLLLQYLLDRWDCAFEALADENADLRATLGKISAITNTAEAATEQHSENAGATAGSGDAMIAENRALRARLAEVIATAPLASPALGLAKEFMARQVERETAAVAGAAPTWD